MFRRCSIAVVGLALAFGLVVGCGPIIRTGWKIDALKARTAWAMMPNQLDYVVYLPSHRVALATAESLKAELAEVKIREVELTVDKNFDSPEGKPPDMADFKIPKDHSAFWLEGLPNTKGPMLVNCWKVFFEGKTKDGRKVNALVHLEVVGSDIKTVVSVQVGGRGDATGTKNLIDRISERVKNLSIPPGSPEERAALKSAFDPGPKGNVEVSEETGEIKIKVG